MSLKKISDLVTGIPASERLFQRKYQVRAVNRMNDILKAKNLSQRDVVERTGWQKAYVSRILSGNGANLTLQTIARFETAVGADVFTIADGISSAPPLAATSELSHERELSQAFVDGTAY